MLIKSIVCDLDGNVVGSAGKEMPVEYPGPGWAEQDPEGIWRLAANTIKEVIKKSRAMPEDIKGVSVTGQMNCSFLIDKNGKLARKKGIIWLDAREGKEKILKKWEKDGTSKWIYQNTGHPPAACLQLMHMYWLAKNEPETLKKAETHLGCKDWIRYKLAGEESRFMDHTEASVTGLFDPAKRKWDEEVFRLIGVDPSLFPPSKGSWEYGGEVTEEASKLTSLKRGTPLAAGAGDVCSTSLGAGCIKSGQATAIIGTAGIYTLSVDEPKLDPAQRWWTNCHAIPDRWLLLAPALTAGSTLRWFKDKMIPDKEKEWIESGGKRVYEYLDNLASSSSLGSNGVMFWPFFSGERSPINKPSARGCFIGLSLWTKRSDIIRSILEGVAYSARDNFRLFKEGGVLIKEIRVSGGGKRSKLWCKIISDVLGYPLHVPKAEEMGAIGAVIEAGCVAGCFQNPSEGAQKLVNIASKVEPNMENNKKYSELFKQYQEFYSKLWAWYDEFAETNERIRRG
jgi:sugar (pentulose or hexulose) kinase